MLCICYSSHFTCDIAYHNMTNFNQIRWNEEIMFQIPSEQKSNKTLIYRNIVFSMTISLL